MRCSSSSNIVIRQICAILPCVSDDDDDINRVAAEGDLAIGCQRDPQNGRWRGPLDQIVNLQGGLYGLVAIRPIVIELALDLSGDL